MRVTFKNTRIVHGVTFENTCIFNIYLWNLIGLVKKKVGGSITQRQIIIKYLCSFFSLV